MRIPLLPDNDRYWLSVGGTYHGHDENHRSILAYSHLFVKDTPINISSAANPWFDPASAYAGNVYSHVDIISVGLKYRWDNPEPAPVSKLYHKYKLSPMEKAGGNAGLFRFFDLERRLYCNLVERNPYARLQVPTFARPSDDRK